MSTVQCRSCIWRAATGTCKMKCQNVKTSTCPLESAIFCPNVGYKVKASIVWNFSKNSSIPCLWTRVPMRPFFSFWVPKGSPFSLIQAHKRFKCQSCHYLMSATLLLVIRYPCNESRASLSLKMSFMHKFAATYCDNFCSSSFHKIGLLWPIVENCFGVPIPTGEGPH